MDKILDWFTDLPRAVQFTLLFLIVGVFAFGIIFFLFPDMFKEEEEQVVREQVLLEMPSASLEDDEETKTETYRRGRFDAATTTSDFWDSLEQDTPGTMVVNESDKSGQGSRPSEEYLDPKIYSELEIYYIRSGAMTKAEIDRMHAERDAQKAAEKPEPVRKQADPDSVFFARVEKAVEIAGKYQNQQEQQSAQPEQVAQEQAAEESQEPVQERRTIDVGPGQPSSADATLPRDGVISSLEQSSRGVIYSDGGAEITPVKATFLKSERVVAGQRVIMRLLEDLYLSSGVVIPANTHISGICNISQRLDIQVSTINYGDRIYRIDMTVYDNDGTEGIYCPIIEKKRGKRAVSNVAGQAVGGLASTAATLFTRNPYLGRVASSGISELSGMTMEDGSIAIDVVAGYDFYLFENIKD